MSPLINEYELVTATGITPLLLTVEQAAVALGLGRTTAYELVMRGHLSSVKVGRRRLVLRDGIQRFIDELVRAQAV
jgi:excisionase family DNA binding protein